MNVDIHISDESNSVDGYATVAIDIPDLGVHEVLDINIGVLPAPSLQQNAITQDLLLIAGVVYILDKAIPRRVAEDCWTRSLNLRLPVSDPERWTMAREYLENSLTFLTGDEWSFRFREPSQDIFVPTYARHIPTAVTADKVALFSGGLDSLVGTLDLLATDASSKLLLIGHYDATLAAGDQLRLWQSLNNSTYYGRTDLRSIRVRPLPSMLARNGQTVTPFRAGRETTLRSRSFLFLALGLYCAHSIGTQVPLVMPENGFIAINIPLTPSRVGTCSTRTTHPYFLHTVRELIQALGLEHSIENPLEGRTKGEVLAMCKDQTTLKRLAHETVSCAHPSRRSVWRRRSARNCGYCLPCIIRRAAFHRVGQDEGTEYGLDFCSGELGLDAPIAGDINAVLDCLNRVQTQEDIAERVLETGPMGNYLTSATQLVARGLEELRVFVRDKGSREIGTRASIT